MHEKLRHRVLGSWAGMMSDHPWWVLGIGVLLAALATVYSIMDLKFQPDRNALISTKLDWNQRYLQYRKDFSFDDLIVLVAVPPGEDGKAKARLFADTLGKKLLAQPNAIKQVYWRIDTWHTSPAAVRLLDWNEFDTAMTGMSQSGLMLGAPNLAAVLAGAPAMMATEQKPGVKIDDQQVVEAIQQFGHLINAIDDAITGKDASAVRTQLDAVMGKRYEYLPVNHGRLLAMMIEPNPSHTDLEPVKPAMLATRKALDQTKAEVTGVEAGLTGLPAIESDETDVTMRDSTLASIIAVVLIAILLIASFHSVLVPLMVVTTLLIAVAWSFGFVTASIGHLQLLSITFTVMLLGLGVAFGIHLVTRFEMVRELKPEGPAGFRQAMIDAMQTMGPGIATGAITTSVAFATTMFTDFTGMAEMGIIAGVGILLCLLAMFTVLPALLRLTRVHRHHIKPPADRIFQLYARQWWEPFHRKPWITVLLVVILSGVGLFGMTDLRYDYNLSNLLPQGLESVEWFNRLTDGAQTPSSNAPIADDKDDQTGDSIWFGASTIEVPNGDMKAAIALAKKRTEAFRAKPSVASVGGAGWLFAPDNQRKIDRITEVRDKLKIWLDAPLPAAQPATQAATQGTLQALGFALSLAQKRPEPADSPRIANALKQLADQLAATSEHLSALDADTADARLAMLNGVFAQWRDALKARIDQALVTRQLMPDDLPAPALRTALGGPHDNVLLLQIYPKGDVYDPAQLDPFMKQMRQVDPLVTGTVVQIYFSTALMMRAYIEAGVFALAAVFILVLIDFQSVADALLALLPVAMGFVLLLGGMGLWDIPLNPANIIVLPLLFGIGVDNGVHMVHRFRAAPQEHPPGLAEGTGKGITLTSLTTIIGFAALLAAHHRGIASLGMTLASGMAMTLAICLTVMPSVLEIRAKRA